MTCRDCNRSLADLTIGDVCPNCKLPVVWSVRHASLGYADAPGERRNAEKAISRDIECRKCGYNLRGLSRERACPECGTDVRWSVGGYFLDYADPHWLTHLKRGTTLLLTCFNVILILGLIFVAFALIDTTNRSNLYVNDMLMRWIAIAFDLGIVLYIAGVWKVTTPEPRTHDEGPAAWFSSMVRSTTCAGMGLFAGVMFVSAIEPNPDLELLWLLTAIAAAASHVIFMQYLITLAKRMHSSVHGRFMQTYQVVYFGFAVVGFGIIIGRSGTRGFDVCCCGSMLGMMGVFFFGIWFLTIIVDLNDTLRKAIASQDVRKLADALS